MPFTKIDIVKAKVIFFTIFIIVGTLLLHAQPTPRGQPDVSNKTLITNANQDHVMGAAALRTDRCDFVSLATRRRRFPKSRSKIRTDKSADLYRRMRQCHFLAAEKGIRHAAQTRAVRDRAAQSDAGVIKTRTEQPSESGKTLR